jgi:hypothetical protein
LVGFRSLPRDMVAMDHDRSRQRHDCKAIECDQLVKGHVSYGR